MDSYLELFAKRKMVLIMSLPQNDVNWCSTAFKAGADAVKVHINLQHRAGGNLFGNYDDNKICFDRMLADAIGPMGIVPGAGCEVIESDLAKVAGSAFDFVSFYAHHMPVSGLGCGKTLMAAMDYSYNLDEAKNIERTGGHVLEASIIRPDEYGQRLNMRDLIAYRQIASSVNIPVVVPTQRYITPADVPYLYKAGVKGIMIGAIVTGKSTDGIESACRGFRKAIDEL